MVKRIVITGDLSRAYAQKVVSEAPEGYVCEIKERTSANESNEMIGRKFGRLICIERVDDYIQKSGKRYRRYLCECDCGARKVILGASLRAGRTNSCGCLCVENHPKKHGFGLSGKLRSGTYTSWAQMRSRCNNPKVPEYKNYGGRGIKVCDRWDDFRNFLLDMGERPAGYSIDRIDVNGDYCKINCRWISHKAQQNNKRTNRIIEIDGVSKSLGEWISAFGKSDGAVRSRIRRGMSPIEALMK